MIKNTIKILTVAAISVTAAGCTSTSEKNFGNLTVRRYAEDRSRVDQELSGNAGYVYGSPQAEKVERKETRRLYYVEFSQEPLKDKVVVEDKDYSLPAPTQNSGQRSDLQNKDNTAKTSSKAVSKTESKSASPYYGYSEPAESAAYQAANIVQSAPVAEAVPAVSFPQTYTIQKDDTLQKISHKFYGSYSKWAKIYEANRDALTDPNNIVPGKSITIPEL